MENLSIKDKSIFAAFSGNMSMRDVDGCAQNIMDYCNEVLFLWDENAGCLLTQGLKNDCSSHQELRPIEQPEFDVKFITVNESTTKIALWGAIGVAVIDLPQRFGPRLEFENGKESIIVKLRTVSGLDLDLGTSVLQVRWNSSSILDYGLTILLSNNTMYHLFLAPQDCSPIRASRVGCRPVSRLRTLAALGETAVDFCFFHNARDVDVQVETAVLLLRGNGDVCLAVGDGEEFPEGDPLPISPLPDENYLNDASAILVLPGEPPGVIIATSRGVIYHTVMIPQDIDQVGVPFKLRKHRLLVIESVLLDPGLLSSSEDFCPYPVRLIADAGHSRRYMAIHGAGVHSVVVEVLSGVQKLMEKDYTDVENFADQSVSLGGSTSVKIPESFVEYLVCSGRPLLGYCVCYYTFLALDSESQVIELPLRRIEVLPFKFYTPPKGETQVSDGPLTWEMRKPFEQQIEQLLNESRVLPRLRFPTQEVSQEQLLALVVRMGNMVRKVTIPSYLKIRKLLAQRVHLVKSMKQLQLREIATLEEDRAAIQLSAEAFAERVQTVVEYIEVQRERLQKISHGITSMRSTPSDAELRMDLTISQIETKLKGYSETLEKLRKSRAYQDVKIQQHFETREIALDNKQTKIIHECLSTVGENISGLITKINELNQLLGVNAD